MYNDDDFIVGSRLELYNLSVKWTIMVLNMYDCGWGSNNFGSVCHLSRPQLIHVDIHPSRPTTKEHLSKSWSKTSYFKCRWPLPDSNVNIITHY